MEEKNELNDIILNKNDSTNSNKKILLAVATLGVILIIVVMLMDSLTSNGTDNLPQAVLPPEPNAKSLQTPIEEPLFEEVEVIEEEPQSSDNLDAIAKKLKKESQSSMDEQEVISPKPTQQKTVKRVEPKVVTPKKVAVKKSTPVVKTSTSGNQYYIQVGSFSKYAPNKKFLKSITDKGYSYKYHKVNRNGKVLNKVLVGPFSSEKEARKALRTIRSSIEAGAFLTKI